MAEATELRQAVTRYVERFNAGDREAWLALFAPDATLEDPVGSDPRVGIEAIGEFWDFVRSLAEAVELRLLDLVKPGGDEVAFTVRIVSTVGGAQLFVDVIEIQTYDEQGRITSMRAFWSADEMAPLTD